MSAAQISAEMRSPRAPSLPAVPAAVVRPHPRGGWTHAIRTGAGASRIYSGWWPTARAVRRALR